ncbi:MAG TPA: hypothetical protein VIV61_01480 [Candidatus Ozemobacteraceae bacterium]
MLKTTAKVLFGALIAIGLLIPAAPDQAEARSKKKVGFFTRVKRAVKHKAKMTVKKTRRAIVKAGCNISNGIHDSATKAKSAITGKKAKRVWVKGHYKTHNKKHTQGHYARVKRHHKPNGGASQTPAPAPMPADPAMPM